jgi:hypothetical protein
MTSRPCSTFTDYSYSSHILPTVIWRNFGSCVITLAQHKNKVLNFYISRLVEHFEMRYFRVDNTPTQHGVG